MTPSPVPSPTPAQAQTRILVQTAAAVCEDKKGQDTRILELDAADSGLSDFFLVTSATNERQAVAIADEIEGRLKREFGVYSNSVEGRRQGEWILLDYVDFVVHVFLAERRAFYDIERLRKSARPLTPAEFDAELKQALAEKTLAARRKSAPKAATQTAPKTATKTAPKTTARAATGAAAAQARPKTRKPAAGARGKAAKKAANKAENKAENSASRVRSAAGKKSGGSAANARSTAKKPAGKKLVAKKKPARKS